MNKVVENQDDIVKLIQLNEEKIKEFGVSKIGLFGSYVRGEQRSDSDVDLIVEFKVGEKSYTHFFNLIEFMEGILQKKIDLLTEKSLSERFKKMIQKETVYVTFNH